MSPYQHGEVFVTDDGAETDLDLGHYERFIDENLNKYSNLTTGKVYWNVLNKERQGDYLGADGADHPPHHRRDQELHLRPGARAPTPTWSSPRSAAPPATSRASPSWRPSARWRMEQGPENCCYIHVVLVRPYFRFRRVQVQAGPALRARSCRAWASRRTSSSPRADGPVGRRHPAARSALFCNVQPGLRH